MSKIVKEHILIEQQLVGNLVSLLYAKLWHFLSSNQFKWPSDKNKKQRNPNIKKLKRVIYNLGFQIPRKNLSSTENLTEHVNHDR